ncbi:hypothetical protein DERF_003432 [Dermatophagoides farinae]|uniref:Uncharacterized protein n=1 Tax=Dermatophagoides farinae TaxID=6954 RepID=A0A922LBH7_DERFA|nr:hypothetical protein DERF_003432 [Dermatophagoides farinae]
MDPTDVHTKQYNNNNNKKIIICQHNIAWRQISSTLSRHWCLMKNLLILPVEIVKNMKRPDSIENRIFKHHYHFGMCRTSSFLLLAFVCLDVLQKRNTNIRTRKENLYSYFDVRSFIHNQNHNHQQHSLTSLNELFDHLIFITIKRID